MTQTIRHYSIWLFVFGILFGMHCHAQTPISGTINQYVSVVDIIPCDSTVVLSSTDGLRPGDLVFIIQMKGAEIRTSDDSTFGTILSTHGAGTCEFLTIGSVGPDRVVFTTRIANLYDPAGLVQLIRVPQYTNARITDKLSAPPWNGRTGGVLVLSVSNNLYLDADVSVSEMGFVGGNASARITAMNKTGYLYNWLTGASGEKGEGIARSKWTYPIAGRGCMATGGGGGNGTNAGGGGGGNGGSGGKGGWSSEHNRPQNWDVGGLPGFAVDSLPRSLRFVLGGGGGGGQQNDLKGSAGGNGGGLVVIKAGTVHGQNHTISANGGKSGSSPDDVQGDGTGGGGAGGTVVLDIDSVASTLYVAARGGKSGDVLSRYNPHGPGGGGGGGAIITKRTLTNLVTDVSGGLAGLNLGKNHGFTGTSWGAENGKDGIVTIGLAWKQPISLGLDIWGGGPFCGTQTVDISASSGFIKYRWNNGDTTRVITVNTPGDYSVVATDPSGCTFTSASVKAWENSPQYNLDAVLDYGTVDYKRNYIRTVQFVNTDDEPIEISRISQGFDIAVIAPLGYPVTIPAGGTLDVVVRLFTSKETDYLDTLYVSIVSPCPDTGKITVKATMNLVYAKYSMPDTTGLVGSTGFGMPVYVRLTPDTLVLPATRMQLNISFDSRVFAPSMVTTGVITGDIIDVVANRRTLTVQFDSVDIRGPQTLLTTVIGTILSSHVRHSPFIVSDVKYQDIFQVPITSITNGSLQVSPVCFQDGRQIRMYASMAATISPNPASEQAVINVELSAPGKYELVVTNTLGQEVDKFIFSKQGSQPEAHISVVDVSRWPGGLYGITFRTPLYATQSIMVVRR